MHEASLVQGLLNLVEKTVADHNAANPEKPVRRVTEVNCQLGLISCVEPRTLTSCFELFAEDTVARDARLTLTTAPLPCTCKKCGKGFELTERMFKCPFCGDINLQFTGGHGLVLTSLQVDSED